MYLKKGTYDSAIHYLRIASEAALAGRRMDNHYGYTTSLARAYDFMGQTDSAFRIIRYVNNGATRYDYISVMVTAAGLLARLHNQQHRYDSAVIYLMQERALKDSITGLETLNSIQYLTSDYQQKTLEREREKQEAVSNYKAKLKNYYFAGGILLLLLVIGVLYRINKQRSRSKKAIETAYEELKTTQAQLVHSEKMASLGELTAGIAHEIQNPLNFVNNFSEVSNELADEMNMELDKGDIAEAKLLANDIRQNLEKITFHGKRADAIVKGMLQHSRNSSGQPEPTDLNKLADEYLRLAYHGLRAKDKTFNSAVETDFDPAVGSVRIIPQDIGRVVMNLLTNAFYAVNEKTRSGVAGQEDYKPTVSISTIRETGRVRIIITDNGNGIPPEIREKIFQPFFTTKPTGEGTGLGLSMSFDIITKGHAGRLTMDSNLGSGTSFTIELPIR
ncbi:MAG: two-component sensor histidine kinase [Chitinophagaceae bacterium]|nr:MAG: two-component sensor histidine kinase [Chitinophagaceae bacterium]